MYYLCIFKIKGLRLSTCSLRPAAIYGVEEQRHLPRILQFIDCGLFFFRIGSATVDWVHVDNLVIQGFDDSMSCVYTSTNVELEAVVAVVVVLAVVVVVVIVVAVVVVAVAVVVIVVVEEVAAVV